MRTPPYRSRRYPGAKAIPADRSATRIVLVMLSGCTLLALVATLIR